MRPSVGRRMRRQAYTLPADLQDVRLLRVVCREEFSLHSAEKLLEHLRHALAWLDSHYIYTPEQARWTGLICAHALQHVLLHADLLYALPMTQLGRQPARTHVGA